MKWELLKSDFESRIVNCRLYNQVKAEYLYDIVVKRGKISKIVRHVNRIPRASSMDYDAQGNLILPAFIDCHCHLFSLGEQSEEVDLRNCTSVDEMLQRIKSFVQSIRPSKRAHSWLFGRGWDQDRFSEKRLPTKHDLDSVENTLPMVMTRVCGHIAVVNSAALNYFESRGVFTHLDSNLVPIESTGLPNGVIKEVALARCWSVIPRQTVLQLESQYLRAQAEALKYGLSGAHCILDNFDELETIRRLDKKRKIKLKLSLFLSIDELDRVEKMPSSRRKEIFIGDSYRVIGFKLFTDGSLGARTAALSQDYSDDPGNKGLLNYPDDIVTEYAKRVKNLGLILATHAIGDRAVEQTINGYIKAKIRKKDGFRIEHCSIVRPELLPRLSRAILSIQPMFAISDYWLKDRIGRSSMRRTGYSFKTLKKHTLVVGGSDAPVESINPLTGISAAINNRSDPDESLSMSEALDLYTRKAAMLSPLTKNSGAIKKGRNCDLVIVDSSDFTNIERLKVKQLYINGIPIHD